ncbi:MAG: hypothetical protein K2W33_14215, partial [Burkholderiales bacterium]|nr:hypothetical protein [Burkholderiales bacterium]
MPPEKGPVDVARLTLRSALSADGGHSLQVLTAEMFDAAARLRVARDDLQQFESRLRESYASFLHESSWRASDDKTANMRLAKRMAAMTPMMDIAGHFQAHEQHMSLLGTFKRAQRVDLDAGSGWADVVVFRVLAEAAVHGFDSVELPASVVASATNARLKGLVDEDGLVRLTSDISRSLLAGLPQFDLGRDVDREVTSTAWYFSKLERVLGCAPKRLEGRSARQWSDWLNGNCARLGVKQQEIHWSGITEWLKLQEESPVYAAQVIAFVKANGVRVHESVLSEDGADSLFFKPLRDARTDEWVVYDNSDQRIESFETASAAREFIARHQGPSQRTLMGHLRSGGLMGSGYRELLLTLGGAQKGFQKGFSSPDWDGDRAQPLGVLAHVRMDEQVGVDGQRVLMVHEVRSEWAQALASQSRIGGEGIGDMPFPAQQDWLALVMKRLVVLAAKEGFEGVAFASGQQVIEQNPFFKGLAGLQWVPSGLPSTQTPLVGGRLIGVGANGVRLWSRDLERPGEIADHVGIRLAKELLASGNANGIGASVGSFSVGLSHIERARESVIDVYDRQIPRAMKRALALVGGEDVSLAGTVRIKQPGVDDVVLNGFAMTAHLKEALGDGVEKLPLFSTNDGLLKTPAGDPVVVYRGEHSADGQWLKTRLPGLSFSTASVAATYAIEPNDRMDLAGDMAPRV